jgi:hypothetical protein
MRILIISVFVILVLLIVLALVSRGDWHLKRNSLNKLPVGKLSLKEGSFYSDESGLLWELQPHHKNIFHQPENTPVPPIPVPYPNVSPPLVFDPYHPNLKFLSSDESGGSYEAILQQKGTYLVTGKKQGTYNYSNPSGFWGYIKHGLLDVLPHFFNSNYDDSLNRTE